MDLKLEIVVEDQTQRLGAAAEQASLEVLAITVYEISREAKQSIQPLPGASPPGRPPHTHRQKQLPAAIGYAVDRARAEAVAGPAASVIGDVGQPLEFGGSYKGQSYEPRPFMGPAFDHNLSTFGDSFAGRIGE